MHLYVQEYAKQKHDSDLPYVQDERNRALNEQTMQPGTPIAPRGSQNSHVLKNFYLDK